MGEAGITTPGEIPRIQLDTHRKAWSVLLISFGIFCSACLTTGLGIYYYLFLSNVSLDVISRVGQGSIGVNGQFEDLERNLQSGDELSTGGQSQAAMFFYDPQQAQRLVASITVKGNSKLTLRRAVRPRFDWNVSNYEIELQSFTGDLDVFVDRNLGREFRLTVSTQNGARVDLGGSGQYTVSAQQGQTQVFNQEGKAVLIPPAGHNGRDIPVGSQGVFDANSPDQVTITSAYTNLLENSTFQDTIQVPSDSGELQEVTKVWRCTNQQDSPPRGAYQTEMRDGRTVLRLVRDDNATSHGETRCLSYFGQNGRDISDYDFLEIRASFNINYQSLPACGREGSECPLMLYMDYIDQNGAPQRWYHGFYYLTPQTGFPLSCNSCRQDHDRVNEKSWYTYESGNLFALLGPSQIPSTVLTVQFYASGHQYDVAVGEVTLLAANFATVPNTP